MVRHPVLLRAVVRSSRREGAQAASCMGRRPARQLTTGRNNLASPSLKLIRPSAADQFKPFVGWLGNVRCSRFSRSSAFSFFATSVGTPVRLPLSTSAFFAHSCRVCAEQPIFSAIDTTVAQRDACSPSCSTTIRTARSRPQVKTCSSSCSYRRSDRNPLKSRGDLMRNGECTPVGVCGPRASSREISCRFRQ